LPVSIYVIVVEYEPAGVVAEMFARYATFAASAETAAVFEKSVVVVLATKL
jgi:hypothetical protein